MADFLAPFTALGEALELALQRVRDPEAAFPDLAAEHLARAELHRGFDLAELARWVLSADALPQQHDIASNFGDPPVTLWSGRQLFVSALVWRTGTTTIHQHAFNGAFQVVQGGSVHARYGFEVRRAVSDGLQLGTLCCMAIERLERGAIRLIRSGPAGAHALFHLEHPSVSLVVRTRDDARHPVQYEYHPPGLAVWPLGRGHQSRRACQVVRMLAELEPEKAVTQVVEALPSRSAADGYALLAELLASGDLALCLQALTAARPRLDPELARAFELALRERDRMSYLMRRRDAVREPELRYLLAILLNAPTRTHALVLAEAHTPGRPGADTLVAWLRALSEVTIKLQVGGGAFEPSVLGLPAADEASCAALRAVLAGTGTAPQQALPFYAAVRHGELFAPLFRE